MRKRPNGLIYHQAGMGKLLTLKHPRPPLFPLTVSNLRADRGHYFSTFQRASSTIWMSFSSSSFASLASAASLESSASIGAGRSMAIFVLPFSV